MFFTQVVLPAKQSRIKFETPIPISSAMCHLLTVLYRSAAPWVPAFCSGGTWWSGRCLHPDWCSRCHRLCSASLGYSVDGWWMGEPEWPDTRLTSTDTYWTSHVNLQWLSSLATTKEQHSICDHDWRGVVSTAQDWGIKAVLESSSAVYKSAG